MRIKSLLTAAALSFVAAGIVALAITGLHRPQTSVEAAQRQSVIEPNSSPCAQQIVVYYFHRQERPATCVSVEFNAKEAIALGFPGQLKDGRLEWRSVNYEERGNEQYATDYKITLPCLVLVRMKCGKAVEWRSLPEVWELVRDKSALVQLVQRNVQEFLDYIAISGACCT
jgi:hypothetical protein